MKKLVFILSLLLMSNILFAQNKDEAEKLVTEGIAHNDKGDFDGAIARYDKALELDKDNLLALAEKAYTLLAQRKYDEAITWCKKAIEVHPGEKNLKTVYVTYGNALDGLNKTDQSLAIYEEGIKLFPDYYQLYFNKGITLTSVKKYDESIASFQKSVLLNPKHGSSHNAIARISAFDNKRIPALLAYCRFLVVEPQGARAKENLQAVQKIMKGSAEQTGKNSINISISPDMLNDTVKNGKVPENSFTTTDLILAMDAGLDYDKKNKNKTEAEQFIRKFETVCASLKESQPGHHGFFWDYYAPYFIAMKDKNLIEPFAYIAFSSSDEPAVATWLELHKNKIDEFYDWSTSFNWKKN